MLCYCLEDVVSLWAPLFHLVHKLVFHVSVITVLYDYGSFNLLQATMFFLKNRTCSPLKGDYISVFKQMSENCTTHR